MEMYQWWMVTTEVAREYSQLNFFLHPAIIFNCIQKYKKK